MKNKKIREIIKEAIIDLKTQKLITEVNIEPVEPKEFKLFNLPNNEKQYGFSTKNKNLYILSFKESCLNITNEEIIKLYNKKDAKKCFDFIMLNFFQNDSDPNQDSSFSKITDLKEPFTIVGNILWLFNELNKNTDKRYFAISAEDKRMNLYSNAIRNYSNDFYVFNKSNYDINYKHDMIIMIKK